MEEWKNLPGQSPFVRNASINQNTKSIGMLCAESRSRVKFCEDGGLSTGVAEF